MTVALVGAMWGIAAVLGVLVWRRHGPAGIADTRKFAVRQLASILPRVVLALIAAAFITTLVPPQYIASVIGHESGMTGIFIGSLIGGLMPAGPMTSYPAALFLWQSGAGAPQMVALLAGWSVFAFHRVLAFELPIMGWRFTVLRLMATGLMPPLAGLLAAAVIALLGDASLFQPLAE